MDMLADWSGTVARFSKVMPRDYKRVLAARAKAEKEGLDVNEQIMAVSHG
jgi:glutamate synthase (NADPH) large chain